MFKDSKNQSKWKMLLSILTGIWIFSILKTGLCQTDVPSGISQVQQLENATTTDQNQVEVKFVDKRVLYNYPEPLKCIVKVNPVIYANTTSIVEVIILDAQENPVPLLSDQLLTIQILNECYIILSHRCSSPTGYTQVIQGMEYEQLALNSDGKYLYKLIRKELGKITVVITLNTRGYLWADYFNDYYLINFAFGEKQSFLQIAQEYQYGSLFRNGPVDNCGFIFYFFLRGPKDGNCLMRLTGVQHLAFSVDSKQILKNEYNGVDTYGNFTFKKDKLYYVELKFITYTGNAFFNFDWNCNGIQEDINNSNYYSHEHVGRVPANQVLVKCAGNYNNDTKICTPKCGDGIKVDLEECDDSNIVNGDGCSQNCTIEKDFKCSVDSSGKSICINQNLPKPTDTPPINSTCNPPPPQNCTNSSTSGSQEGNSTNCQSNCTGPTNSNNDVKGFEILCVCVAALCSIVCLCVNTKFRCLIIEHIQMICMLALTNVDLSKEINDFFKIIAQSLFGFSFISPPKIFDFYDKSENANSFLNQEVSKIGFRSISTIANIFYYIISWILVAALTFAILLILGYIQNKNNNLKQKLEEILKDKRLINVQIQYTYLGFLLIYISSINEFNYICVTSFSWAIIVPFIFMLFYAFVLYLNFVSSLKGYSPKWLTEDLKLYIIQTEEKEDPTTKLYRFIRLMYLLLLSTVVCLFSNKLIQFAFLLISQVVYHCYLFKYRPLGYEIFIQSAAIGLSEFIYTVTFLFSSEVYPLPFLIFFFASQLLLLILILKYSTENYCLCSKPKPENNSQVFEQSMEEIDHHEGNKGQEDIKEEVIELRKDNNDQTEKNEDEECKINSPKTNAESNNNNGSDSFKRRNCIEEVKIQNNSFSGSLYESISKDI